MTDLSQDRRVFVDADACPVKEEIIHICSEFKKEIFFVASFRNMTSKFQEVKWIWVEPGRDAADIKIMNLIQANDIVVTDDIGLSAACIGKKAHVINSRGMVIDYQNIDLLLATRHISAVNRRAGKHSKGPKKIQKEDKIKFSHVLKKFLSKNAGDLKVL